ncbi:MAG: hypothetical protein ACFHWZ_16155 [Phycisphaerales bacterium]
MTDAATGFTGDRDAIAREFVEFLQIGGRKNARDKAHTGLAHDPASVGGDDSGRLLTPMLKTEEPEVTESGGMSRSPHPEDAAFFVGMGRLTTPEALSGGQDTRFPVQDGQGDRGVGTVTSHTRGVR